MDRKDIIQPGGFWNGYEEDFNAKWNFQKGDRIVLAPGRYGPIDFEGRYSDIEIVCEDNVQIERMSFGPLGKNIKITGSPDKNFLIKNWKGNFFAMRCMATGDIHFEDIAVDGCAMGIQVIYREDPKKAALPFQNVTLRNLHITNVQQEGVYVGADVPSPIKINGVFDKLAVKNTGRDGIQFRNGKFNVQNCLVDTTGLNKEDSHAHGYAYGTSSEGLIFKNNEGVNIGYYGLYVLGYGDILIEGNNIESKDTCLNVLNWAKVEEDLFKVGYQEITLKNNRFKGRNNVILRDPKKNPMKVNMYPGNIFEGGLKVETSNGVELKEIAAPPVSEPPTRWPDKVPIGEQTLIIYSDGTVKVKE